MSQGNESLQETMLDRVIWEEGLINIFELKAKENLNPTKNWFVSLGITAFQAGGTKGTPGLSDLRNAEMIQDTGDENGEVCVWVGAVCGALGNILGGLHSPVM